MLNNKIVVTAYTPANKAYQQVLRFNEGIKYTGNPQSATISIDTNYIPRFNYSLIQNYHDITVTFPIVNGTINNINSIYFKNGIVNSVYYEDPEEQNPAITYGGSSSTTINNDITIDSITPLYGLPSSNFIQNGQTIKYEIKTVKVIDGIRYTPAEVASSISYTETNSGDPYMMGLSLTFNNYEDYFILRRISGTDIQYVTALIPHTTNLSDNAFATEPGDEDTWNNIITNRDYYFMPNTNGIYKIHITLDPETTLDNNLTFGVFVNSLTTPVHERKVTDTAHYDWYEYYTLSTTDKVYITYKNVSNIALRYYKIKITLKQTE